MARAQPRRGMMLQLVAGTIAAAGFVVAVTPQVQARQAMVFTDGPRGGGARLLPPAAGGRSGPPVTTRQLERYAQVLQLDESQRQSATSMLDAMHAEYTKVSGEARKRIEELQAEFQETRDITVLTGKMPGIARDMREKRSAMERTFFDDLRLTLTAEQDARWDKMERMRRRDLSAGQSSLSGEGIDLTQIVADLQLPAEHAESVAPVIDQYETDLDRVIIERNKINDEREARMSGGPGALTPEQMGEIMQESREAGTKVRDVNRQYARQIAAQLPEDWAARFNAAVRQAWFPQVYGPGHMPRTLAAAQGLEDLTPEQRASLKELQEAYAREAQAVNEKWAAAIEEDETSGNSGTMVIGGGAVMRIATDDGTQGESALAKARDARSNLDKRFGDKLKSLLSQDQQARLPKRGEGEQASDDAGQRMGYTVEMTHESDGVNPPRERVRVTTPDGTTTEGESAPPPPPPPPAPPAPPASPSGGSR